ncbi:DinB family protein [Streptomyces sp. SCSIO 30461]|uniref:DinB family protein n=1 Tax=Streptomyces sp. SCSIO 30461 TaxID=3118085 RepID=UPI0030CDA513
MSDLVTRTVHDLSGHMNRVRAALEVLEAAGRGDAVLCGADRRRLSGAGHFPAYGRELDWTAREVAGHLTDSAKVFAQRVHQFLADGGPPCLIPFDPLDEERVAAYGAVCLAEALDRLSAAQSGLRTTILDIPASELHREGQRAIGGIITLADLIRFLPGHQHDHAVQVEFMADGGSS